MPPPTTSTSDPSASATGQPTPNGPRTPTIAPGSRRHRLRVVAPTARNVCRRSAAAVGHALTEIGTSPAPNA